MKILSREIAYNGFSKLELLSIENDHGNIVSRELNNRKSGVASLLYNTVTEKYIFVKQFRIGSFSNTIEIPAGLLDIDGENTEQAIIREILEETGYVVDNIEPLDIKSFYCAIGSSNETIHLFYSETSTQINSGGGIDNEDIEIVEYTKAEVIENLKKGIFIDGKTIISILSKIV